MEKNKLKYSMEMRTLTLTKWRLRHDKDIWFLQDGEPQYFAGVTRALLACYQGN
jgi:hypothetical protein